MSDACHHGPTEQRPSPSAVKAMVDGIAAEWSAEGERMTPPRRRVLEMLIAAGEPVKAYFLMDHFGPDGQVAKPPTVYRALEFLRGKGLVHRIASTNAFVACTAGAGAHAAAFLICDCCGGTVEISIAGADIVSRSAETIGFVLHQTTIEGHGRCAMCRTESVMEPKSPPFPARQLKI